MDTILAILVTSFRNMLRQNHCHKITECRQVLYLHILRFWKEYNDINYIKKNLKVDAISQDRCILQSITYNCADKWWRFRTCRWGAFNNNSISHRQLTRVWRVTKKRRWLSMICRFDSFFLTLERTWMNEWMNEWGHARREGPVCWLVVIWSNWELMAPFKSIQSRSNVPHSTSLRMAISRSEPGL